MLRHLVIPALAALWLLTGCQGSQIRSFENLHAGMDKHQVLETMGTPTATTRMHGKDRWIYRFYEDGIRFDKEVHFLDGFVIYMGEPVVPPAEKTAEAQDKKNADREVAIEKEKVEKAEQNRVDYSQYEAEAHQKAKVQYMPSFVDLK